MPRIYIFKRFERSATGVSGAADSELELADGAPIADRYLARAFPSTYVIDRNGAVLFTRKGPVEDWLAYLPFLQHLAGD